jgi:hypothetical protein
MASSYVFGPFRIFTISIRIGFSDLLNQYGGATFFLEKLFDSQKSTPTKVVVGLAPSVRQKL